ncbi:sugar phosphate isomerase/epimerase [Mesorhizobium sp. BE184]|uniref:sugar phosphate isomerase/epimerase family protein n=1 Tax=Mesorhizobium sp. BE184 TaxID=2817714 RepID=UPI002866A31E|nr:sugar phosphate isomerase/epimerase [Mesorhizobium sp. BE184]MDR7034944.1 sugar phosphate isomerase/epimerase [Mesorhizobium sp. BE184]
MRLGIFAKTFPGTDLASILSEVAAAGFDTAQYNFACSGLSAMPDRIPSEAAAAIARASTSAGVPLCAVSGTYNMAHPDPAVRADGLQRLEVIAGSCAAIGTRLVTLCTGTRDPDDQWRHHPDNGSSEAWRDMRAEMEKAVAVAMRHGIRLGIEPELANIVDSAAKARRLLDEMGSDRLAIVLDPANLFDKVDPSTQRRIVAEAIDLLGPDIAMGHAKDRAADGAFATAGKGVLDYAHYLACLRRAGFDGDLVAHGLAADEAKGVADFLRGHLQ